MFVSNFVLLKGVVGKDPEMFTAQSGLLIAKFSLATVEKSKNKEKEDITYWHNCVAFDKAAEIVRDNVKKGSRLVINGKIQYDNYEAKDGTKRSMTKIVVNELFNIFVPDKAANSANFANVGQSLEEKKSRFASNFDISKPVDYDDLPF